MMVKTLVISAAKTLQWFPKIWIALFRLNRFSLAAAAQKQAAGRYSGGRFRPY
jgi:hypothetical protein